MGCDINIYLEHKVNEKWELSDKLISNNRNYLLFGLLAGVRNDKVIPLSLPRGFPENSSAGLLKKWEIWRDDGHTPSYFLLSELLKFKEQNSILTGYVNIEDYRIFLKKGVPDCWYNSLWNTKIISNQEMNRIISLLSFIENDQYYTEIIWEQPNKNISPEFWEESLNEMKKIDSNPENVRCVFWFDN